MAELVQQVVMRIIQERTIPARADDESEE